MKRIATRIGMGALAACLLAVSGGASAELKIAVVNIPKLVAEAPQAQAARKRMDQQFAARRTQMESLQKQLVDDAEKLKRDATVMTPDARAKAEDALRIKQRDFARKQDEYNEDVGRAARTEEGKMRETIAKVIEQVVKQGQYDLVLSEGILHAADKINITMQVLDQLKKQP